METNVKAVELKELWRRCKEDGDERARERLVVAYSPLVKYVAGRMAAGLPSHVEEGDLISYGLIGLIGAIERYDLEREIKFETYAVSRIKGAIIDELRSLDWVPRSVRAKARDVERDPRRAREPAPAGADRGGDGREARESRSTTSATRCSRSPTPRCSRSTTSGRSPTPTGGQVSLLDTIRDPQAVDPQAEMDAVELKDRLADAIESLPDRERLVIALYYYENLTLREIGEVLGVTESRVSQLHTKAVLGLRGTLSQPLSPRLQAGAREPPHGDLTSRDAHEVSPPRQLTETCAVCRRSLLIGERSRVYVNQDGASMTVCELCRPRAEAAGWVRPEDAAAQTVRDVRDWPPPARPRRAVRRDSRAHPAAPRPRSSRPQNGGRPA